MTGSPLPLGPITDREQLGWQRRAVRVLTELLERAHRDRLPVVQWSVAFAGAGLVARCLRGDAARRRADFDAWCQALGATGRRERRQGSTTHLSAVARHYDGLVSVALLADLYHDDDLDQFVSRCAQAVERGDWFYLYDKAGQLEDAAGRLARVAGDTWDQISAGKPRPRKAAVRAAVAWFGRHYRAARLLHPLEPGSKGVAW